MLLLSRVALFSYFIARSSPKGDPMIDLLPLGNGAMMPLPRCSPVRCSRRSQFPSFDCGEDAGAVAVVALGIQAPGRDLAPRIIMPTISPGCRVFSTRSPMPAAPESVHIHGPPGTVEIVRAAGDRVRPPRGHDRAARWRAARDSDRPEGGRCGRRGSYRIPVLAYRVESKIRQRAFNVEALRGPNIPREQGRCVRGRMSLPMW